MAVPERVECSHTAYTEYKTKQLRESLKVANSQVLQLSDKMRDDLEKGITAPARASDEKKVDDAWRIVNMISGRK